MSGFLGAPYYIFCFSFFNYESLYFHFVLLCAHLCDHPDNPLCIWQIQIFLYDSLFCPGCFSVLWHSLVHLYPTPKFTQSWNRQGLSTSVHGSHTYSESCHLYFEKKEVKEAFQRVTHSNPLRQTAKFCPSKQNMYCSSEALSKTLWLLNPCVLSQMFYRLATEGHLDFFSMILNASKQKEMGSHTIWLLYITLSNKI